MTILRRWTEMRRRLRSRSAPVLALLTSHSVVMCMCMWATVPLSQAQTWSFEINQEHLETLQRRYRVSFTCAFMLSSSFLYSVPPFVHLTLSPSLPWSFLLPSGVFSWNILCLPNMTSEMTLTILTSSMHGRIACIHSHTCTYMHVHELYMYVPRLSFPQN